MIYEKKRAYDQDEQYFTWLDEFSQPRLSALLGANLTTCEEFKDADKTLRICLGRLLGKEQSSPQCSSRIASLQNNLAVNYWLNADQADKAVERFQDAINRIFSADLQKHSSTTDSKDASGWQMDQSEETIENCQQLLFDEELTQIIGLLLNNICQCLTSMQGDPTKDGAGPSLAFYNKLALKFFEHQCNQSWSDPVVRLRLETM